MDNPAIDEVIQASSPHELIVSFLERECGVTPAQYDALYLRMVEWAGTYQEKVAVNTFSPIMLLEQVRREFDSAVGLVEFALVAADLQWGPRMLKLPQWDNPVWVMALVGFPTVIAAAEQKVRLAT